MKAIIQTDYQKANVVEINTPSLLPISVKVETKYVPILRYDLLKLSGKISTSYPKVMGYGGAGVVTQVGNLRSSSLLNKKVIFLNPWGSFQEYVISNIPPLVIPVPKNVSLKEAASLIGGPDLAVTLYKLIKKKNKDVIIYGANSVTGLVLMQLLTQYTKLNIVPKVRADSEGYLKYKIAQYNIRTHNKPSSSEYTVIDLVGEAINNQLLLEYYGETEIISVAQKDVPGIKFISQPNLPQDYKFLMQEISKNNLFIPINEIFSFREFDAAFNYQANSHSRGRNLLSF